MKLRLTLSEEGLRDRRILETYGKSKEGIVRDILVPANITLHALHYAIQRAFGWQNSHLHHYEFPKGVFNKLLLAFGSAETPLYIDWEKLCGIYFRFPSEDYNDIYWDDDYEGDESIKSWFRRKYKAPYRYEGFSEHYLECRNFVAKERIRNPSIRVSPSFAEYTAAKNEGREPDLRTESIDTISFEDMNRMWEYGMEELLERIELIDLIFPHHVSLPKNWREQIIRLSDSSEATVFVLKRLAHLQKSLVDAYNLYGQDESAGIIAYNKAYREYKLFVSEYDLKPIPVSDSLVYKYDYGDGWQIDICCEEVFYTKDGWDYPNKYGYVSPPISTEDVLRSTEAYDSSNVAVDSETREQIARVVALFRPVCISADGLPVLDDVGGIHGYCDFLKELHEGSDEEREEMRDWAKGQGWTGRRQKPENIL